MIENEDRRICPPPSLAAEEPGSPSGEEVQDERTAADSTTQRILNIMAEFLEGRGEREIGRGGEGRGEREIGRGGEGKRRDREGRGRGEREIGEGRGRGERDREGRGRGERDREGRGRGERDREGRGRGERDRKGRSVCVCGGGGDTQYW